MTYKMRTRVEFSRTELELFDELEAWGVQKGAVISTRSHHKRHDSDTDLVAGKNAPQTEESRAVEVSFTAPNGSPMRIRESRHGRPADNLRVIFLTVQALRMNEVRGVADMMQAAYLQLAQPGDPWAVLGIERTTDEAKIRSAYVARAREAHPDRGGSPNEMVALNAAMARIRIEIDTAAAS